MKEVDTKNVTAECSHQASCRVVCPNPRASGSDGVAVTVAHDIAKAAHRQTTDAPLTWGNRIRSSFRFYRVFSAGRTAGRWWRIERPALEQLVGDVVHGRVVGACEQRFERRSRFERRFTS